MIQGQPHQKQQQDQRQLKSSTLGELHYGEMATHAQHPFLKFMVKTCFVSNISSFIFLFGYFRFLDVVPPHDQPLMNAIGGYFFFGCMYGIFSFFSFRFAKFIEHQTIVRAITHNRRYEWHTKYDTNLTDAQMKKVPERTEKVTAAQASNAGNRFFKVTFFLTLASLLTCFFGIYAFFQSI